VTAINASGVQFGEGVINVQFRVDASMLSGAAGTVPVTIVNTFESVPGRVMLQFNLEAQVRKQTTFSYSTYNYKAGSVQCKVCRLIKKKTETKTNFAIDCTRYNLIDLKSSTTGTTINDVLLQIIIGLQTTFKIDLQHVLYGWCHRWANVDSTFPERQLNVP
jgi:hypothetical protein